MKDQKTPGQLAALSKAKKGPLSAIPSRSMVRNTLKPVVAITVDTSNVGFREAGVQNTGEQKPAKRADPIESQAIHRIKNSSTSNYLFQNEQKDYNIDTTLVDSITFLLCGLEGITELLHSEDALEAINSSDSGKEFNKFLEIVRKYGNKSKANLNDFLSVLNAGKDRISRLKQLLARLSGSFQSSIHQPEVKCSDSIGKLALDFVAECKSKGTGTSSHPTSHLLLTLLGLDLGFGPDNSDKVLGTDGGQISSKLDKLGFDSYFARQLVRMVYRDVHADLLTGNGDDVADALVEKFASVMIQKIKGGFASSPDICKEIGQATDLSLIDSKMTRYDFTNNLSVGVIEMDLELYSNTCRKDFRFILPNGKKIVHKNQGSLTSVNIPKLTSSGEKAVEFIYPTVLDAVNQIESKESFASSDYDWVGLTYNFYDHRFEWLSKEQSKTDSVYNHSKSSFYIGYDYLKNISSQVLQNGLVIPLSNKGANFIKTMRTDNINLFISTSQDSTVQDLLDYLNRILEQQKMTNKPVEASHLKFESLKNSKVAHVTEPSGKLIDLLKQVGWTNEENQQQGGSYICTFQIKYPMPDAEAKSSHLLIEETRIHAKHSLKTSLTSFYQFMFRELFVKHLVKTAGRSYIAGQPVEYWLPTVLILDMRKYSATVVNVKGGLDLKELVPLIEEMGISFNTKYSLFGAILRSPQAPYDSYPCQIVGTEARIYYDGPFRKLTTKDLDDSIIQYVLLTRSHVDVETS